MSEPERDDDVVASGPGETPREGPDQEPTAAGDESGPGLPPPTSVESLVGALLEAGPEVAEHVVRAAQELLLAVQVIVDAADKAVREQQDLRADRDDIRDDVRDDPEDGTPAPVRRLDLAE